MIITPVPHGLEDRLGRSTLPRTLGRVHISDIYGDLFERLEPKRYTGGVPPPAILEAGLSLEMMLEEGLKRRLGERPGELVSEEGIILSPDLVIFNGAVRVGEIKLTWMSTRELPTEQSNGFPPKFDKWFVQMMAYCHVMETDQARLIGFFVLSDYSHMKKGEGRRMPGPDLRAWDVTFTPRELRENWTKLINHGHSMGLL